MQNPLYKKPETPNYGHPEIQKAFIDASINNKELMQKELSVNLEAQRLLRKRIQMMGEFINELPSSDPQYSTLIGQIQMDQIELDELNIRGSLLSQKIADD